MLSQPRIIDLTDTVKITDLTLTMTDTMTAAVESNVVISTQVHFTTDSDTRSRNLYENLVPVVLYKKLARVLVNLVQVFSDTSFLHAIEHTLFQHRNCVARDMHRVTRLAGELFWCKKL